MFLLGTAVAGVFLYTLVAGIFVVVLVDNSPPEPCDHDWVPEKFTMLRCHNHPDKLRAASPSTLCPPCLRNEKKKRYPTTLVAAFWPITVPFFFFRTVGTLVLKVLSSVYYLPRRLL